MFGVDVLTFLTWICIGVLAFFFGSFIIFIFTRIAARAFLMELFNFFDNIENEQNGKEKS